MLDLPLGEACLADEMVGGSGLKVEAAEQPNHNGELGSIGSDALEPAKAMNVAG
jgi:hypothetical protein